MNKFALAALALTTWTLAACSAGSNTGTDASIAADSSASGAAANAAGGAIAGSDSNGTVSFLQRRDSIQNKLQRVMDLFVPPALASNRCPTIDSGCIQSGSNAELVLSNCNYGSSLATWNGTEIVSLGTGAIACGTFPTPSGTYLQRQFQTSGVAGTATRTSAAGTVVTIDNASSNLANFNGDTITAFTGGGYGTQVTFNGSGKRSAVAIKERVSTSLMDHTIDGGLTIAESGSGAGISRTVTGNITVYHNKLRVIGTAAFDNVVYNDTCCGPVGGSITTTFAAGSNVSPTNAGALAVGASETLSFSACGTATYSTTFSNVNETVSVGNCF